MVAKSGASGYDAGKASLREGLCVMASLKSAARGKKTAGAAKAEAKAGGGPGGLAEYLLGRTPAEDVAAYDAADLKKAADLAARAVARHKKGESVIAIEAESGVARQGRPL